MNLTSLFTMNNESDPFIIEKGNANYKIVHQFQNGIFQNSSVTIKVYNQNQQLVECNYSWNTNNAQPHGYNSTSRNIHIQEQDDFKNFTNMYEFSAQEINSFIRVFIHPKQDPTTEIIAKIGPIQMDPDTKYTVQSVLYSGIVNVPIKVGRDLESANIIISPQNIIIRLANQPQNDCLKILNHLTEVRVTYNEKKGPVSERCFKLIFPKRSVLQNNSLLPCIQLENSLELQAESRHFRDYVFIILRSLAAKQTFIDEKIISNINTDPKTYIKDFTAFTESILKYIHYSQICTHYQYSLKRLKEDKQYLQGEVDSMEEECHLIISTFKQILQQQGVQCGEEIEYQTRKDYRMSRRDIQDENSMLKDRIQQLEEELLFLQNFHATAENGSNCNRKSSSRYKSNSNSNLSCSGNEELISQKESESNIKQIELKYSRKLQKAYMEIEEVKDSLNAKIQEQLLIINNLENKNSDLKNQLQILERSQNYFSVEHQRKSAAAKNNGNSGGSSAMNSEFEALRKQIQAYQMEMSIRQAKNEDLLRLQLQNSQLQNEMHLMRQNQCNYSQNQNDNNTSQLLTTRNRIFETTPLRNRNNTIQNSEDIIQNQNRTLRSSSYNNIPSQRNISLNQSKPNLPPFQQYQQQSYDMTSQCTLNSGRQRIASINNNRCNTVSDSQDNFNKLQHNLKSSPLTGRNSQKTLKHVNISNKENIHSGNIVGQVNYLEINDNYQNYLKPKELQNKNTTPFISNQKQNFAHKTDMPIIREAQILRQNQNNNNNNNINYNNMKIQQFNQNNEIDVQNKGYDIQSRQQNQQIYSQRYQNQ